MRQAVRRLRVSELSSKGGNVSSFKIDKGIELTEAVTRGNNKYPWDEMEIGDSFFVPGRKLHNFLATLDNRNRKNGAHFVARTVEGGVRVWRDR